MHLTIQTLTPQRLKGPLLLAEFCYQQAISWSETQVKLNVCKLREELCRSPLSLWCLLCTVCLAQASEDTWWLGQAALVFGCIQNSLTQDHWWHYSSRMLEVSMVSEGWHLGRPPRARDAFWFSFGWARQGASTPGLSLPSLKCPNKYLAVFFQKLGSNEQLLSYLLDAERIFVIMPPHKVYQGSREPVDCKQLHCEGGDQYWELCSTADSNLKKKKTTYLIDFFKVPLMSLGTEIAQCFFFFNARICYFIMLNNDWY